MLDVTGVDIAEEDVAAQLLDRMAELLSHDVTPLPGAAELLDDLHRAEVPCALVTATHRQLVEPVLDAVGQASLRGLRCRRRGTAQQAGARSVPQAAALLGVDPAHCVALEDSPTGSGVGGGGRVHDGGHARACWRSPPDRTGSSCRACARSLSVAGLDLAEHWHARALPEHRPEPQPRRHHDRGDRSCGRSCRRSTRVGVSSAPLSRIVTPPRPFCTAVMHPDRLGSRHTPVHSSR